MKIKHKNSKRADNFSIFVDVEAARLAVDAFLKRAYEHCVSSTHPIICEEQTYYTKILLDLRHCNSVYEVFELLCNTFMRLSEFEENVKKNSSADYRQTRSAWGAGYDPEPYKPLIKLCQDLLANEFFCFFDSCSFKKNKKSKVDSNKSSISISVSAPEQQRKKEQEKKWFFAYFC